jgi:Ca-activated chloride channel family protein
MIFASPYILWLLLIVPGILAFLWLAHRQRQQLMTRFIESRLLPGLIVGISKKRQRLRAALFALAVTGLILALARPQWGFDWQEVRVRGIDILIAIDTSKSMLAEDVAPNRVSRAKLAALDLLKLAKTDRVGLIAFAGTAFLQCPLTIDNTVFQQSLDMLDTSLLPQGGTAISEAIQVAASAYKEADNHKVLVLLTDGEDHDSRPVEAARKAAEAGMRIYTIGIGTAEGELLRVRDAAGKTDYVRDEQGNVVKSRLDEELLRQIASASEGGFYLPLRGARTMDVLYEKGLSTLPKSDQTEKLVKQYRERYHWPLAAAILFAIAEMLYPERRRKRRGFALLRKTAVTTAVLLLPALASASSSGALRAYREGDFAESLKEYDRLIQKRQDDPRLRFNAGASAYKNGRFDRAVKDFGQALNSQDLKLQELGYYNRGNAQYNLGEQAPDPRIRSELWKKALQDFESTLKLNPKDSDAA